MLQAALAPSSRQLRQVDARHLGTGQECRIGPLGTAGEHGHAVSQLPRLIEQLCLRLGHPQFWRHKRKGVSGRLVSSGDTPQSAPGRPAVSCSSVWQTPMQLGAHTGTPVGCPATSRCLCTPSACRTQVQRQLSSPAAAAMASRYQLTLKIWRDGLAEESRNPHRAFTNLPNGKELQQKRTFLLFCWF